MTHCPKRVWDNRIYHEHLVHDSDQSKISTEVAYRPDCVSAWCCLKIIYYSLQPIYNHWVITSGSTPFRPLANLVGLDWKVHACGYAAHAAGRAEQFVHRPVLSFKNH